MRSICSSIRRSSLRTRIASLPSSSRTRSRLPWITAIGLFTSCAMLAVSWPTAASFSLRTSCCCAVSSSRVRSATLASSSAFQRCSAPVFSSMLSSSRSRCTRELADLVAAVNRAHAGRQRARFDALHGLRHAFQRREDAARQAQRDGGRAEHHGEEDRADRNQHADLEQREGLLQKPHVEHAHAPALAVEQRQVARDVPVAHHEGAVEPGVAAQQHLVVHGLRHARADGAVRRVVAEQAHVGADAHVVEEQRGGAAAAERQRALRVDDAG